MSAQGHYSKRATHFGFQIVMSINQINVLVVDDDAGVCWAVTMTTGMWAVTGELLSRRQTSKPSMPGIMTSRMIRSGACLRASASPSAAAAPPARLQAPVDCLIWRREQRVYFRTLPADEAIAAATLRQGRSFGVICNALARAGDVDTAPTRAAQLLASWLAEGLLAA